ncbi:hypothetical protein [Desulforapulum autotrophicum]|uniref:hypothetical protein n=1 Tax=Desulforapulum autotrophicum TaxID=2296 RepID=UPI000311F23A|nr:hypothetical protein [Desulforapulum autotrophicum]
MTPLVEIHHLSKFYPITGGLLHRKMGEATAYHLVIFFASRLSMTPLQSIKSRSGTKLAD